MAADWIKMRVNLRDDPAVISVAISLGIEEDTVVGKLHRLWSWADQHAKEGVATVSPQWLDRYLGAPNFCERLSEVGWMKIENDKVSFPNFDRHNGKSAKTRLYSAERKRVSRKCHKNVTKMSQKNVTDVTQHTAQHVTNFCDKSVTREEKRREEKNKDKNPLPPFPENLKTPEFETAWSNWQTYRTEKRKTLTPSTIERQLKMLSEAGPKDAIAMIEKSISNGWDGLFELKNDGHESKNGDAPQLGKVRSTTTDYSNLKDTF